jgi:hypothetical protein
MWRDPLSGVRWADGVRVGHHMLAELTDDEADALSAQGFRRIRTYARDDAGRIWTSGQIPIQRAPCLNLVRPAQYVFLQGLGMEMEEIALPEGWRRIVCREATTGKLLGEVDAVDDASPSYFQRWRDDQPGPTS